jgi:transcriptional regulator with XRE-family HTH domain
MKRIWQVIEREMQTHGLTAREMAGKLNIDPSQLSRIRSGQTADLSADTLSHLLAGMRSLGSDQIELLAAYLADKLGGRISGRTSSQAAERMMVAETPTLYDAGEIASPDLPDTELDLRVAAAIDALAAAAPRNRRLQELIVSLAEYVRAEIPH